ncbi:hypothetical protein U5R87_004277 [Cronobacter dublinensis]|nr:hypothetical protein [Cronobacter dublinensis]EMA8657008.1 hypothetical protein [Cronobacter dublinensis]
MSTENELYLCIGHSLYSAAPDNAKTVLLDAELSPESDHAMFSFDYIDNAGKKNWFTPESAKTDSELMDCLVKLRHYYIENNLTNGRPAWHGCEVTLDVEKMKLSIDFRYDD